MLGPGERRDIGFDLRHLMPELLQVIGPDGLHGLPVCGYVLYLFY
jgi:hypothetical protein